MRSMDPSLTCCLLGNDDCGVSMMMESSKMSSKMWMPKGMSTQTMRWVHIGRMAPSMMVSARVRWVPCMSCMRMCWMTCMLGICCMRWMSSMSRVSLVCMLCVSWMSWNLWLSCKSKYQLVAIHDENRSGCGIVFRRDLAREMTWLHGLPFAPVIFSR